MSLISPSPLSLTPQYLSSGPLQIPTSGTAARRCVVRRRSARSSQEGNKRSETSCRRRSRKRKPEPEAYEQWAHEWHTKPCTSLAYRLSLLNPLDGHNHPLWAATSKDKPPRSSFCTALRLAVGHAFVSEYTRRFKRDLNPSMSSANADPGSAPWNTSSSTAIYSHKLEKKLISTTGACAPP
jgi:hypothetical protein